MFPKSLYSARQLALIRLHEHKRRKLALIVELRIVGNIFNTKRLQGRFLNIAARLKYSPYNTSFGVWLLLIDSSTKKCESKIIIVSSSLPFTFIVKLNVLSIMIPENGYIILI